MKMRLLLLVPIAFLGCASNTTPSNEQFLTRCWDAVATGENEYEMSFEAITFASIGEGGTYARSVTCPEARMRFSFMPPEVEDRFERAEQVTMRGLLAVGLRGRARVMPVERVDQDFLSVRITRLLSLERMSEKDTESFITRHHIGQGGQQ